MTSSAGESPGAGRSPGRDGEDAPLGTLLSGTPPSGSLLRAGETFTAADLQSMAMDGVVVRLTDGVYAAADTADDAALRARALHDGSEGTLVIGRESALWVWLGGGPHRGPVHLLAVNGIRRRRYLIEQRVHEVRAHPADLTTIGGNPITTPARTVFDLALADPERTLPALLARSEGLLGAADLLEYIGGRRRAPGTRRMLTALGEMTRPGERPGNAGEPLSRR